MQDDHSKSSYLSLNIMMNFFFVWWDFWRSFLLVTFKYALQYCTIVTRMYTASSYHLFYNWNFLSFDPLYSFFPPPPSLLLVFYFVVQFDPTLAVKRSFSVFLRCRHDYVCGLFVLNTSLLFGTTRCSRLIFLNLNFTFLFPAPTRKTAI